MTNDDILRKIQGLLAKADGTDNEHERDAFYAKAQSLMLKHAIDEAMLEAAGGKTEDGEPVVETFVFSVDDRFRPGKIQLLHGIAETNRVQAVFHRATKKNQAASLVGFKSDIEFVKLLYTSALMQALSSGSKAFSSHDGYGTRHTFLSNFVLGFAQTVVQRLAAAQRDAQREAGTGAELVLVDRQDRVDAKFADAFPKVGTARGSISNNSGARAAGRVAGQRADLSGGRNSVANNTKALR